MEYTLDSLRQKTDAELTALVKNGLMNDVCENDDLPMLRYLVDERHLPIDTPYDETLPIVQAAGYGSIEMMDFLLAHGADINSLTNDDCYTPLVVAAMENRPDVVLHLLDLGADPQLGYEAFEIMHSMMLYYPDVMRRLLECGCDPDLFDYEWETPLDDCARGAEYNAIYHEEDAFIRAMGIRIDEHLMETMQILLDYGACPYITKAYPNDTNLPDTPNGILMGEIIRQAKLNERPSIRLYIEILERKCDGSSFLNKLKHYESIGADLTDSCPWKYGMNFLQHAVRFGNTEAVDYLIQKGCSWEDNVDYIQSACWSGSRDMVIKLLNEGLLPKHPERLWESIFLYGTMSPGMQRLPLEQGWKPKPEPDGETVLHAIARQKDSPDALELFVEYAERMGLDPDARSLTGKTPRDIAAKCGFHALVSYLDTRKVSLKETFEISNSEDRITRS